MRNIHIGILVGLLSLSQGIRETYAQNGQDKSEIESIEFTESTDSIDSIIQDTLGAAEFTDDEDHFTEIDLHSEKSEKRKQATAIPPEPMEDDGVKVTEIEDIEIAPQLTFGQKCQKLSQTTKETLKEWSLNALKMLKWNRHHPSSAKYKDVKKWKAMGHRYAAGYDKDDKLLMMVDLAYPNILFLHHAPKTLLGTLGVGAFNLQTAEHFIEKNITKLVEKHQGKKLKKFLQEEKPSASDVENAGPGLPDKFTLADLNLEKLSNQSLEKFHQLMKKLGLKDNFLKYVQFEKNAKGEYDMYFLTPHFSSRPPKVIDFKAYKSSYRDALIVATAMSALKGVISAIPYPPYKNIASVLVERWLMLYETQRLGHSAQVLQHLEDAYLGDQDSPFIGLPKEELEKGLRFVHNSNTMMSNIFPKIVLGRHKPWMRKLKHQDQKRERALDWLQKKNKDIELIHRNFAVEFDKRNKPKNLYILGHSHMFRKKPITGIDYKYPELEWVRRHYVEMGQQSMNFMDAIIPVPVVPSVIQMVYNGLFTDELLRVKNWEARLAAWMLNQQDVHNHKKYEPMIKMIYEKRLNPFELSRSEEEKLIRSRKALLNIQ